MQHTLHPNVKNLVGHRFSRWLVLDYLGKSMWRCRCDCGNERLVFTGALTHKKSTSCGCLRAEIASKKSTTHGLTKSPEYKTWAGVKRRCYNENEKAYESYGAAGITMCQEWRDSFEAFLAHMGPKPSMDHTIDRIKNEKGYEPDNCRWATKAEQNRNKRNNRLLTFRGVTQTLAEWTRSTNLSHGTIQQRLDRGWSIERTLTLPASYAKQTR
jgi:hypothetical protein